LLRGLLGDDAFSDFADEGAAEMEPPDSGSPAQGRERRPPREDPGRSGERGEAAEPLRPPEYLIPNYRVSVEFPWETGDHVKPLNGVNKGVLTYPKYGMTKGRPSVIFDATRLYQAAGVTSTRLHSDVFDVANIFRGDGAFVAGIGFLDSALNPPPQDPAYFDAVVADYLNGHEGRFFSRDALNVDLRALGVRDTSNQIIDIDRWEAWLYWYPVSDAAVEDGDNYVWDDATGAKASYVALADGGFEIYFRAGESNQGPSYMSPPTDVPVLRGPHTTWSRYAHATERILDYLIANSLDLDTGMVTAPRFIEIWNEPNGRGYEGPYAESSPAGDVTPDLWADDFLRMVDEMNDAVSSFATTGGFGFSDEGARRFVASMRGEASDKVLELLQDIQLADLPFLSFHVYGMEAHDTGDNPAQLMDRAMVFADKLVDLRAAVNRLSWWQRNFDGPYTPGPVPWLEGLEIPAEENTAPPLHITEWNAWTEREEDWQFPPLGLWGAFVSFGLTVMQHPVLDIERAHYWDGRVALGPRGDEDPRDRGVGLFSAIQWESREVAFFARPSALAMSLHSGIAGDDWVPAEIVRTANTSVRYPDVLGAARERCEVTALATQSEDRQRRTIILTNLSAGEREVVVAVSGLFGAPEQPNTGYTATIRTLDCGRFPARGIHINPQEPFTPSVVPSTDPVVPDPQDVEAAFDDHIDVTHHIIQADYAPPWLAEEEIPLTIPGYGVVRIDIVPGGVEAEIVPR